MTATSRLGGEPPPLPDAGDGEHADINLSNLREALETAHPAGIDVSSGVEKAPGVKDVKLIAAFLAEARRLERTAV